MTMAAKMRERVSGAYETAVGSFEPFHENTQKQKNQKALKKQHVSIGQ